MFAWTTRPQVVKGSASIGQEYLGTLLGLRLAAAGVGISIPALRLIVHGKHAEAAQLELSCHDWVVAHGRHDEYGLWLHRNLSLRPILAVMEFVPGKSLDQVELTVLGKSPSVWYQIGAMGVFDVVRNNSDRLPCGDVWDSPGNPGNILLTPNGNLVPIDNSTCSLAITFASRYLARVSALVRDVEAAIAHVSAVIDAGTAPRQGES